MDRPFSNTENYVREHVDCLTLQFFFEKFMINHFSNFWEKFNSWVSHSPLFVFTELNDTWNDVFISRFFTNRFANQSNVSHQSKSNFSVLIFDQLSDHWDKMINWVILANNWGNFTNCLSKGCSYVDWCITCNFGWNWNDDLFKKSLRIAFFSHNV